MKSWVILLVALAFVPSVRGQVQERKLMDRLLKPDMTQGNPLQKKTFGKASAVPLKNAGKSQETFMGLRDASMKSYPFARSFLGIKNPWLGRKTYPAQKAALRSDSTLNNVDSKFAVEKAETSPYNDATKQAHFGTLKAPTRSFVAQGTAEGAVSQMTEKIHDKMTIDEVRELLNKPH